MLITCPLIKIMAVKADHQVLVVITHSKWCKRHHTQIHHGGNGIKCNFPASEVEISTSLFTVRVEDNSCYTSQLQLNVTVDSSLDNKTVECVYNNGTTTAVIGTSAIEIIKGARKSQLYSCMK